MSDLDTADLARDLFDRLASTMPDNPQRATAVQRLVRRRHRRRVATRASIGVACVAGVGAVLVVGTSKRAEPATPAAPGQTQVTAVADTTAPTDPCQLKAAAVGGASTTVPSSDGRFKGAGTVTAIDGDVLSVAIHDATIAVTKLTATIAPDVQYTEAGVPTATRPALAVGGQIAFGAVANPDGTYVINRLDVHPVDLSAGTPDDDAKKSAAASGRPAGATSTAQTPPACSS